MQLIDRRIFVTLRLIVIQHDLASFLILCAPKMHPGYVSEHSIQRNGFAERWHERRYGAGLILLSEAANAYRNDAKTGYRSPEN